MGGPERTAAHPETISSVCVSSRTMVVTWPFFAASRPCDLECGGDAPKARLGPLHNHVALTGRDGDFTGQIPCTGGTHVAGTL